MDTQKGEQTVQISQKQLLELMTNESKIGVLMALQYFKSLNLSQISQFIDKSIPTAHHHVKSLALDGFIQLDNKSITKMGKYYTLSEIGYKIMSRTIEEQKKGVANQEPLVKNELHYKDISAVLRSFSLISKNVSHFVARYIENNAIELAKDKLDDPNPDIMILNLALYTDDQKEKLERAFDTLLETVTEIQTKSMKLKNNKETQEPIIHFLYTLSTPVSSIPIE